MLTKLGRGDRSISSESRYPFRVIPANAGLCFLGSYEVVSVLVEHECIFSRSHKARIEADKVELDSAVFESLAYTGKTH